ncbi:MAG: threonine--tRNA ligase, partial [Nanoarchaeota archaeon]
GVFDFEYELKLSTKPESAMGEQDLWDKAETALTEALEKTGRAFEVAQGDGAFYGPKVDFVIRDALGRGWQLATVQVDFQMPLRFGLEYEGSDGLRHTPVMVHRAILGSIERFMAILIEHYAGRFPLWLCPVQAIVLPIADRHVEFATTALDGLRAEGVRAEIDARTESVNKKIRDAQVRKIPLMLTLGDKEMGNGTFAVRTLDGKVAFGLDGKLFSLRLADAVRQRKKSFDVS